MSRQKWIAAPLLLTLFNFTQAHATEKLDFNEEKYKVTRPNIAKVSVEWIKNKGKKFDVHLSIENLADFPIIMMLSDFKCSKSGHTAALRHTHWNMGERTIDFKTGESKDFTMVCPHGEVDEKEPEYKINIQRVDSNKSGDGKTTGQIIAKDIEWKVKVVN